MTTLRTVQRLFRFLSKNLLCNADFLNPKPELVFKAGWVQSRSCQIETLSEIYRTFFGIDKGFFVEIGAHNGLFASNSVGLIDQQWSGLQIDPVPSHVAQLTARLCKNERVKVLETAIAGPGTLSITLTLADTLTSANEALLDEYRETQWARGSLTSNTITVEAQTLDQILAEHNVEPGFEVLMIDVEGFESEVFSGFDLNYYRPKMIIVELVDLHPDLASTRLSDAATYMMLLEADYITVYKDSINTVLVTHEHWNLRFCRA